MTVVLTGAGGQLGRAVIAAAKSAGIAITAHDRAALDIADADAVHRAVDGASVVINAAAYTDVDRAEGDLLETWRVNCSGPAVLADACNEGGAALLHISTDYVFDGNDRKAYTERDAVSPLGAYGASKAEGEEAIADSLKRHVILRTAWLFSATGRSFVRSMLTAARTRDELSVVSDRHGCPTAADDLAGAVLHVAQAMAQPKHKHWGIYHYCGAPPTTWFKFAEAIFAHHPKPPKLVPISGKDWPAPAPRPDNAVLDCKKIKRDYGLEQPDWRAALGPVVAAIMAEGAT